MSKYCWRYIYRVRNIKCYRAISLKLLITSKNISDKSFSVREGRHTGPPFFLSLEALKLRQGQLHFFKWNHVFFFDDIITDFKTKSATYNTRSFYTEKICRLKFKRLSEESWAESKIGESLVRFQWVLGNSRKKSNNF